MKGTSDEFEVIHIHGMGLVDKDAKAIPGLMHYPFDEDSYERKFVDLVFCGSYHGIVAFDRDGLEVTSRGHRSLRLETTWYFPFILVGTLGI